MYRFGMETESPIRNSAINIKEARTDYAAAIGTFLPRIVANAETGKAFRAFDRPGYQWLYRKDF